MKRFLKYFLSLPATEGSAYFLKLGKKDLKMQQIAKSLDMTVTETFRHLQRLSDAKLIAKKVDGAYSITSLGNLAIGLLSSFNFIMKNDNYFLEHDVSCLPYEFVNRLGELSAGEFCGEAMADFNRVRKMVYDADECIWAIGEQVESSHVQPTIEKVSKGLNFRLILQQGFAPNFKFPSGIELLKEKRFLERVPVSLLVTRPFHVLLGKSSTKVSRHPS